MTRLEERLLDASADKPLVWMRFIDDVFFIWTHGEEKLKSFINHLNSSHETIKFTSEQSRDRISFLDVQVSVGEGGVLSTDLFCKPTDTHQYLHKKSCHPCSVKIIDRLTGGNRMRESFWQYRLDCFAPKGLNTRQVDT